jgi:hypothetical protein
VWLGIPRYHRTECDVCHVRKRRNNRKRFALYQLFVDKTLPKTPEWRLFDALYFGAFIE